MQRPVLFLAISAFFTASALGAELTGIVQVAGKPIQWAVVWIEVPTPMPAAQVTRVTLDQRNKGPLIPSSLPPE